MHTTIVYEGKTYNIPNTLHLALNDIDHLCGVQTCDTNCFECILEDLHNNPLRRVVKNVLYKLAKEFKDENITDKV